MSFLVPKSKRVWIYGSWDGEKFLDNGKYAYLIANKTAPNIKSVWVSNNAELVSTLQRRGFVAYCTWQLRGIFYCLVAKYYFIDHYPLNRGLFSPVNLWLSGGAKIFQMWHGLPLKRIDNAGARHKLHQSALVKLFSPLSFLLLVNTKLNTCIVAPSKFFVQVLNVTFFARKNHKVVSGHPRYAFIKSPEEGTLFQADVREKIKNLRQSGKKIVLYGPTFRDAGKDSLTKVFPFEKLDAFLERNNCVFAAKFHEADAVSIAKAGNLKNVFFLPKGYDIYESMDLFDVLITDYSSICLDYLFLDRPLLYFLFDLDEYQMCSRMLLFPDYENFVPGPVAHTFDELLVLLDASLNQPQDAYFVEKRRKFRSFVYEREDFSFENLHLTF
jgi:CDP-glycerol glycerophosphotransferase (TagB/SpsB family)